MPHYFSIVWTLTLHIFYLFFFTLQVRLFSISTTLRWSHTSVFLSISGKPWTCAFERSAYKHPIPPHPVPSSKFRLQIISQNFLDATCAFFIFTGHASRIFCFWKYYSPLEKYCSDNNQNLLDLFPVKKKKEFRASDTQLSVAPQFPSIEIVAFFFFRLSRKSPEHSCQFLQLPIDEF